MSCDAFSPEFKQIRLKVGLIKQSTRFIKHFLEVATEPPMDLFISKLILPYRLTCCGSNIAVSLSLRRRQLISVTDTSQVCHVNGYGFTSHNILVPCVFGLIVTGCTFQLVVPVFLYYF